MSRHVLKHDKSRRVAWPPVPCMTTVLLYTATSPRVGYCAKLPNPLIPLIPYFSIRPLRLSQWQSRPILVPTKFLERLISQFLYIRSCCLLTLISGNKTLSSLLNRRFPLSLVLMKWTTISRTLHCWYSVDSSQSAIHPVPFHVRCSQAWWKKWNVKSAFCHIALVSEISCCICC